MFQRQSWVAWESESESGSQFDYRADRTGQGRPH